MMETEDSEPTGRYCQVDAIVIPNSYITSNEEQGTFNDAFHEFTREQVIQCVDEERCVCVCACTERV